MLPIEVGEAVQEYQIFWDERSDHLPEANRLIDLIRQYEPTHVWSSTHLFRPLQLLYHMGFECPEVDGRNLGSTREESVWTSLIWVMDPLIKLQAGLLGDQYNEYIDRTIFLRGRAELAQAIQNLPEPDEVRDMLSQPDFDRICFIHLYLSGRIQPSNTAHYRLRAMMTLIDRVDHAAYFRRSRDELRDAVIRMGLHRIPSYAPLFHQYDSVGRVELYIAILRMHPRDEVLANLLTNPGPPDSRAPTRLEIAQPHVMLLFDRLGPSMAAKMTRQYGYPFKTPNQTVAVVVQEPPIDLFGMASDPQVLDRPGPYWLVGRFLRWWLVSSPDWRHMGLNDLSFDNSDQWVERVMRFDPDYSWARLHIDRVNQVYRYLHHYWFVTDSDSNLLSLLQAQLPRDPALGPFNNVHWSIGFKSHLTLDPEQARSRYVLPSQVRSEPPMAIMTWPIEQVWPIVEEYLQTQTNQAELRQAIDRISHPPWFDGLDSIHLYIIAKRDWEFFRVRLERLSDLSRHEWLDDHGLPQLKAARSGYWVMEAIMRGPHAEFALRQLGIPDDLYTSDGIDASDILAMDPFRVVRRSNLVKRDERARATPLAIARCLGFRLETAVWDLNTLYDIEYADYNLSDDDPTAPIPVVTRPQDLNGLIGPEPSYPAVMLGGLLRYRLYPA